jgi:hypothetical protein
MKTLRAHSTWPGRQEPDQDVDTFVAAVMRSHESLLRNFRRLASAAAWPVAGDSRRDREVIESYGAAYGATSIDAKPRRTEVR